MCAADPNLITYNYFPQDTLKLFRKFRKVHSAVFEYNVLKLAVHSRNLSLFGIVEGCLCCCCVALKKVGMAMFFQLNKCGSVYFFVI